MGYARRKGDLKSAQNDDSQAKKSAAAAAGGEGEETKAECPISLCPPSGTRDFYPEEMRMRNWLFGASYHLITPRRFWVPAQTLANPIAR